MKTKIVYILTSSPDDIYWEQTYVSVFSLLQHEKNARIVLLTDESTAGTLIGSRAKIRDLVSEVVVHTFEAGVSNMRRSRWLKTKMRELVQGDFIYIDGDTIINAPLNDIDECPWSIGAVEDAHRPLCKHYGREKLQRQAKTLGFGIADETYYFNGGVLYVKDCPEAYTFFNQWHENWKRSVTFGINQDMPALVQSDIQCGHLIHRLAGEWNCQIMYGFNFYSKAKIIHYFASRYSPDSGTYIYYFMNPKNFGHIKHTGNIDSETKERLCHPLSCFDDRTELIGGSDVDILNTHAYKFVRLVYLKLPRLFSILQSIFYRINRINKMKKE